MFIESYVSYCSRVLALVRFMWELPALIENRSALLKVAEKKFIDGRSTMELLEPAKTEAERRRVALVALLEVSESERYFGMTEYDRQEVLRCHRIIKEYISLRDPECRVLQPERSVARRAK